MTDMTAADIAFATLVYVSLPAVLLYPLIYGLTSPWWKSWIGRALLFKSMGVLILISFSALYQFFGPTYWGRDYVRIIGMSLFLIGVYFALFAMLQVKWEARRTRQPGETWRNHKEGDRRDGGGTSW